MGICEAKGHAQTGSYFFITKDFFTHCPNPFLYLCFRTILKLAVVAHGYASFPMYVLLPKRGFRDKSGDQVTVRSCSV